jgi:hypothetical protein
MTASTRLRVSALTEGELLITRDTVFFDTRASRAMSLMVAGLDPDSRSLKPILVHAVEGDRMAFR